MDNQVRLLPAVIGAAAVVVILRLAAMSVGMEASLTSGAASAAEGEAAAPPEAAPGAAPASEGAAQTAAPAATPAAAGHKPAEAKAVETAQAGQAQSKGEADVLRGLSDRRTELDARANELALREQLLAATEKQVDEKIAELKALQMKLDTMLAQRDDAQKAQLNALVKMYETMKPPDAAKIFAELDRRILADVAGSMKPAKVGPILAAMEPAKAQEVTALLANRLLLPQPQPQPTDASGAAPSSVPAPAAAPAPETPALPTEPAASAAPAAAPAPPPGSPAG